MNRNQWSSLLPQDSHTEQDVLLSQVMTGQKAQPESWEVNRISIFLKCSHMCKTNCNLFSLLWKRDWSFAVSNSNTANLPWFLNKFVSLIFYDVSATDAWIVHSHFWDHSLAWDDWVFQSTAETVYEDRSDGLISEPIDESTQTSGEDMNKNIKSCLDVYNYQSF